MICQILSTLYILADFEGSALLVWASICVVRIFVQVPVAANRTFFTGRQLWFQISLSYTYTYCKIIIMNNLNL